LAAPQASGSIPPVSNFAFATTKVLYALMVNRLGCVHPQHAMSERTAMTEHTATWAKRGTRSGRFHPQDGKLEIAFRRTGVQVWRSAMGHYIGLTPLGAQDAVAKGPVTRSDVISNSGLIAPTVLDRSGRPVSSPLERVASQQVRLGRGTNATRRSSNS
jgi:hypothetical protein